MTALPEKVGAFYYGQTDPTNWHPDPISTSKRPHLACFLNFQYLNALLSGGDSVFSALWKIINTPIMSNMSPIGVAMLIISIANINLFQKDSQDTNL